VEVWAAAENALKHALESQGIAYSINTGDGAFYEADRRDRAQASVRFNLQYKTAANAAAAGEDAAEDVATPQVILGSVERMTGILTEHFAGKWPLWLHL
jgi:threonyl-tRNA synthetase